MGKILEKTKWIVQMGGKTEKILYSKVLVIHFNYSSVYTLVPNFLTYPFPHTSLQACSIL